MVLSAWPAEILMPNAVASPDSPKDPVTPRQRKQTLYASSFSNHGAMVADHKNPADPGRQAQVAGHIEKARAAPKKGPMEMPSPRDCKATLLQGSGSVQVTDGSPRKGHGSPKKASTVHFFIESEGPVQASRVDLKTENEYWTQSSNMSALDTRGELIRHKDARDSWKQLDCSARKQRDMQSQVLGGSSRAASSAQSVPKLSSASGMSPRNYSLKEIRLPLSAREQKHNEVATSEESQLSGFTPKPRFTKSMSPRSTAKAFRDSTNDGLRRSNSQFTDLRADDACTPTSARSPRRSEMHDVATTYWTNCATEKSRLNAERIGSRRGEQALKENAGSLIHNHVPTGHSPRQSEEKKLWQEERLCNCESPSGMHTSSEITRRRRELQSSKSMGDLPTQKMTASERKRVDMASGQLRQATGLPKAMGDDGSGSSWTSPRSMRATVREPPCAKTAVRGLMNQPSMSKFRNMEPDSPQARKVREQTTNFSIF